jgi:hypothetical protein
MTRTRFYEIIGESMFYDAAEINGSAYLSTSATMIKEQRDWADGDLSKGLDFSSAPYWLTAYGVSPIPIHDFEDMCRELGEKADYR